MRVMALGLAGLLLLAQDPAVPAAWIEPLGYADSIDPADREAAVTALKRLVEPQRELLKKLARSDERALIVQGLVGDPNARGGLIKLLKSDDAGRRRLAAEALAHAGDTSGVAELKEAMEDPDLGVALAAVRALVRIRSGSSVRAILKAFESETRLPKMLGAYGLELLQPKSQTAFIVDRLAGEDGYAIALNTPSVMECLGAPSEASRQLARTLKERFEGDDMPEAERDALGLLCLRLGIIDWTQVFGYLGRPGSGPAAWAFRRIPRMRMLRKSIVVWQAVPLIEALAKKEEMSEAEKAHFEALKDLLAKICGWARPEGSPQEQAATFRERYDRLWTGLVDGDAELAIGEGVAWLRSRQQKDGSWSYCTCSPQRGGSYSQGATALTGYTLLKTGVSQEDPAIESALAFLLKTPVDKIVDAPTYSIALQAMFLSAFHAAGRPDRKGATKAEPAEGGAVSSRLQECVDWLVNARVIMEEGGYEYVAWTYAKPQPNSKNCDSSNTQFAVLGLLAGRNGGAKIPAGLWASIAGHWKGIQCEDGGWPYAGAKGAQSTTSMTGAGITCMLVAEAARSGTATEKVAREDAAVKRALALWEKTYPVAAVGPFGDGHAGGTYYDLYSIERAMMLGGIERIGNRDWYHDGALGLLWNQRGDGAWSDTCGTCFALLFLKRAYVAVETRSGK